jgi:hypothetical protein
MDPKPECVDHQGRECDSCLIDIDNREHVVFEAMASVQQPESNAPQAMVGVQDLNPISYNYVTQSHSPRLTLPLDTQNWAKSCFRKEPATHR